MTFSHAARPYPSAGPSHRRSASMGYSDGDFHPLPPVVSDGDRFLDAVSENELFRPPQLANPPPTHPRAVTDPTGVAHPVYQTPSGSSFSPSASTPSRDRLPSSSSMTSVGGSLRGRRAPVPAALDLSPSSERYRMEAIEETKYAPSRDLGLGASTAPEGRRVVTDPVEQPRSTYLESAPTLPPLHMSNHGPSAYVPPRSSSMAQFSPSAPAVPLSAVGNGSRRDSAGDILLDSYYLRASSRSTNDQLSPNPYSTFSPTTPDQTDPETLDRRMLIGVGELSTPRWTSAHGHLRTPSVPQTFGVSPPMPPPASMHVGSAPHHWVKGESGLGLGVGVGVGVGAGVGVGVGIMEKVEESPQRETRTRHRSMSHHESPPRTQQQTREYNSVRPTPSTERASILSLGALGDFTFDSTMEAALAATMSLEDVIPPHTAPMPPAARFTSAPPAPLPQPALQPGVPSPGSARQRIYARRHSRQLAATSPPTSVQELPPMAPANLAPTQAPLPSPARAKLTPPSSADSQTFSRSSRESRKTPPAKDRDGSNARARHSPSASHHDIIKHFAPKDFSHLPPSPSSASINQFLRASGSVNNFASVGTPPANTAQSYFSPSTTRLARSDSGALRSGKHGWDVDRDTAEALRKLDGLGGTPKNKSKARMSAVGPSSRPGTPKSKMSDKPSGKQSVTSEPESSSPLNTWIDIAEELPAVPPRGRLRSFGEEIPEKRESSSSTSFVGTPTSRESLPTTSTTPSSAKEKSRRTSAGSEVSATSDISIHPEGSYEKVGELAVPPVPPLPKGYVSMRQGLAQAQYIPLQEPSPINDFAPPLSSPPTSTQSTTSDGSTKPKINKKWSFSSALNLKLHREPSSPSAAPSDFLEPGPSTPWSEIQRAELGSPRSESSAMTRHDSQSITPVPSALAVPKAQPSSKRLTPSGIPFFRRASSSSIQSKASSITPPQASIPETPRTAAPSKIPSSGQSRKSVLMHLPSMLRGSNSKRGLSQQLAPAPEPTGPEPVSASLGWKGRARGKVSAPPEIMDHVVKPKSSVESGLNRASVSSNHSESTVNGSTRPNLPAIAGSPSVRPVASSTSLRAAPPSATPTKIPRIVGGRTNLPSPSSSNMPPPAVPLPSSRSGHLSTASASARTVSNTGSIGDLTRTGLSEFGAINGAGVRQTTSGAHRNHLLAPMSSRPEPKRQFARPAEIPVRRDQPGNMPPSRRNLPQPPSSSTVTAMTVSAAAKRTSRDVRPPLSRRGSKDTPSDKESSSGEATTIKPSKSLHSKLSVPAAAPRIPSSSSVGAPGLGLRKSSLVTESPSVSPDQDDEAAADAEMVAYVNRRRARRASGNKKDDLADVNDFPEDIEPATPMTQRTFISKHLARLSDFERKEVLDFDQIYFVPHSRIIRPSQPGGEYNHGYDDERGDYLVVEGDHLCYRYEVTGVLGKGSFGQVLGCRDHKTGGNVAVKIIRNKKRFHAQALVEVKILQQLVEWDPEDKHFMVRMTDHFYFRGHLCIVTELLSINLYELIKANQFAGFSTVLIRRFTVQMLASLQLMRSHRIVHCDLKPEVIDFGSSCLETEKVYTYIQSRFYRSPEVILGMNYAMAIDMWSLGCILAELYTGVPIFPGENEQEQLACIMEVLGVPDRYIVEKASRRKHFFDATGAPRPFVNAKGRRRRPGTKTLAAVLKCDDELFVDFIAKCLAWDPDKRLKPQPAMRHPWILASRRRQVPTPSIPDRASQRSSSTSFLGSSRNSIRAIGNLANNDSGGSSGGSSQRDKKSLLISPPTPLMARQPSQAVPSSAPRMGHSSSSNRLAHTSLRNSTLMVPTKVSLN
ncbi:hypothetical protein EHS25_009694 [Saitozyma podzolica]|uniref:Protein kinase domain-containing protein n=1 Tax=Saitozyma podzolica TaxID=1890683 RepID=A0A427YJX9_9TREE|nr:hypothetical protein EHS25_009694 [Saitozyma podzolica]